jgi:CubicO group peptidase (beta-lactamase class C family)
MATAIGFVSTLAGAALHDGAIASLDDPCEAYLPPLSGSAYAGASVRNLLRMSSGVAWSEDGDGDRRADVRRIARAILSGRADAILEFMATLPRAHPQGTVFNYSTGEACVLAAVVAAAVGRPLADYLSEAIWGPAGMEADGHWQLESEGGQELGGLGVSATLRDVGRFAQLLLEDGVGLDGRRVLAAGWRDLAGQPDGEATAFGRLGPGSPAGFGYGWWALPGAPFADGLHAGAFLALGAYGQRIYINPPEGLVAVIQSAWRQPQDREAEVETSMMLRAVVRALATQAA